jgi:hypothetical protein
MTSWLPTLLWRLAGAAIGAAALLVAGHFYSLAGGT